MAKDRKHCRLFQNLLGKGDETPRFQCWLPESSFYYAGLLPSRAQVRYGTACEKSVDTVVRTQDPGLSIFAEAASKLGREGGAFEQVLQAALMPTWGRESRTGLPGSRWNTSASEDGLEPACGLGHGRREWECSGDALECQAEELGPPVGVGTGMVTRSQGLGVGPRGSPCSRPAGCPLSRKAAAVGPTQDAQQQEG